MANNNNNDKPKFDPNGELSQEARRRIQAQFGHVKDQDAKLFVGKKGEKSSITEANLKAQATLYIGNCEDCEYEVNAQCTKILIEGCRGTTIRLNAGVLTNMLEMWRCENINLVVNTKISTLQLDLCKKLDVQFTKKDLYHSMVWAGLHDVTLGFHDAPEHSLKSGFLQMKEKYPELDERMDQFIVRFLDNKLVQERVVRLANGYPSTGREREIFEENQRRKEEYMRKQAEDLIKFVPKKYLQQGPKAGRNDPCPCKSGKKFKKCCGANTKSDKDEKDDSAPPAAPAPAAAKKE